MPSQILDVHEHSQDDNGLAIRKEIVQGLQRPAGSKTLPTMLLYDERGLRLYDDLTTEAPEYYLFGAEEEILKNKANDIVRVMHGGSGVVANEVVLELGAGALRKTSHVLRSLAGLVDGASGDGPVTYYALDLEQRELVRTLVLRGKVETRGMWGTYDDGLKFVQSGGLRSTTIQSSVGFFSSDLSRDTSPDSRFSSTSSTSSMHSGSSPPSTPGETQPPLHLLFLGSSIGNFTREAGASSGDTLLLGLDHDNESHVIETAYNDPRATRNASKWEYVNKYVVAERQHEAFFKCKEDHETFRFDEDELIKIEQSVKFSDRDAHTLFINSGLRPIQRWTDSSSRYSLWLLERPMFSFPLLSSPTTCVFDIAIWVPSPDDWENLWALWDFVTRNMIPPSMLFQKPIDLRHICLFYLGHIPTFLDIHLSKLLNEPHTEPEHFKNIFERGIDPNVDDPTMCHPHSDVPTADDEWPTLTAILQFQSRVRARVHKLYKDIDAGKRILDRKTGRVLFMTLEHEAMHAETLLYMLLQRAGTGTVPPLGFSTPDWVSLKEYWGALPKPSSPTVVLGPATLTLGHDDDETEDASASDARTHEFGWDNEHPKREVSVGQFRIEWRPVTNGEYYTFYRSKGGEGLDLPASWINKDGEVQVRTLYGPVPMDVAYQWPVITTYNDLSRYAMVKGGRLPTEQELRLFLDKFESGYEGGANVGFRNWHPIPATTGGERDGGRGGNGGVWEWTSTTLEKYEGFVASALYPGYTADFFDNSHQVVLGGSYASIPRISERRSLRNWYQRNYPYPWVGGRVVYDM
ncbi:C-type lectin protein [Mucidula mucida]|nr:C-type lectin protein [Mucidula mucida]